MTPHNLRIWAMINAEVVRVEGMKAENENRKDRGYAQAYDESAFEEKAAEIERLSMSFEQEFR